MKMIVAVLAALLAMPAAAQAQARLREPSPFYVFGEYDYYSATGGSLSGGGVGAGWHLNRYLALQAGGQYSRKSGVDLTNGYIEALLGVPLGPRLSAYASLGGAYLSASTNTVIGTVSVSRSGYRAGLGVEYSISDHWALRTGWHRQNTFGVFDDIGVGIAFRF